MAAAVFLALIGTVALVAFVAGAEERALEGEELVEVYVVTEPILGGTAGEDIEEQVVVEEVPTKVRPADAVDNLASLRGRVAAVDLQPGEQLIESRFVEVAEFNDRELGVQVPEDLLELTIEMDPQRAIGGLLEPGQTVAVIASFEPFDLTATVVEINGEEVALPQAIADEVDGATPNTTDIIIRRALVTAVQEARLAGRVGSSEEEDRLNTAPEDVLLVTLALSPNDAERLVFTQEFGLIWLAIDRDTVPDSEDAIKTRTNIYNESDATDGDLLTGILENAEDTTETENAETEDANQP
ncbi:MAG: RcpC/CpaB family pilus assembly protein [Acidimicrobiia bacterium]|nr:RcpC/CpaB family pilus assembly protein [Acidimicrobiia bacterium]